MKLTCIIAFRNEGAEVRRTVESIRSTTDDCPIILINDNSTDSYDYKRVAEDYNCKYTKNTVSKGAALNKAYGILLCETEHFILLDAHMRFYNRDWDKQYLEVLQQNPNSIICANTYPLKFIDEDKHIVNENATPAPTYHSGYKAAYITFEGGHDFEAKWANKLDVSAGDVVEIPCVLGATYGCSKTWWNHIGGYEGLVGWGFEEPLISIKTWLAGGKCLFLHKLNVGHLYRPKNPYPVDIYKIHANQLFLINLFIYNQEDINKYETRMFNRIGKTQFDTAKTFFLKHFNLFISIKNHFWSHVAKHNFKYFEELNSHSK